MMLNLSLDSNVLRNKLKFAIEYDGFDHETKDPGSTIANSDIGRIKQVLINLISNSYKFTQKGGIFVTISQEKLFDFESFEYQSILRFTVKDTGIGIPHEKQANLFKIFGKIAQSNKKINVEGSGLGLNISKKLVKALGGRIDLNSEEKKGTEVTFTVKNHPQPQRTEPREISLNFETSSGSYNISEELISIHRLNKIHKFCPQES